MNWDSKKTLVVDTYYLLFHLLWWNYILKFASNLCFWILIQIVIQLMFTIFPHKTRRYYFFVRCSTASIIRNYKISPTYSSVPNRRACMFINFDKKFPPARSYFGLHVYWFWEKFPPCTSIFSCTAALFWSARLLILRKNSPLHGLILVCTFIDFKKIFPPARLFYSAQQSYFGLHVY